MKPKFGSSSHTFNGLVALVAREIHLAAKATRLSTSPHTSHYNTLDKPHWSHYPTIPYFQDTSRW